MWGGIIERRWGRRSTTLSCTSSSPSLSVTASPSRLPHYLCHLLLPRIFWWPLLHQLCPCCGCCHHRHNLRGVFSPLVWPLSNRPGKHPPILASPCGALTQQHLRGPPRPYYSLGGLRRPELCTTSGQPLTATAQLDFTFQRLHCRW